MKIIIVILVLVSFVASLSYWDSTSSCGLFNALSRNQFTLSNATCAPIAVCNTLFNLPLTTPGSCKSIKTCVSNAKSMDDYVKCRVTDSNCTTMAASYIVAVSTLADGSTGFVAYYFNGTACGTTNTSVVTEFIGPNSDICTGICTQNLFAVGKATSCGPDSNTACYGVSDAVSLSWFLHLLF